MGWFKRKQKFPEPTGNVVSFVQSTWGHSITVRERGKDKNGLLWLKGSGWCYPRPKLGDWIVIPGAGGEEWRFRITEIEYVRDPDDMFHYTAYYDIGNL